MSRAPPDPLFTMHGGMKAIHSIYFRRTPDGRSFIYCGTESGQVHIWDFQMLRQINSIKIGPSPCVSILYHHNYITQEKGGSVTFWKENSFNWEKITSFDCDFKMFCQIILYNNILIHPCSDNQVRFTEINDLSDLNLKDGVISESNDKFGMVMCAKFIDKHNLLLLAFENGLMCSINPHNGKFKTDVKFNSECPLSFDYCDSSDFGIIGFSNKDVFKFTVDEKCDILKVKSTELTNPGTSSIAIRKDGVIFVVGTWDKAIRYFSAKSLKLLAVLNHHNLPVECLLFIPDFNDGNNENISESCLLAGGRDGRLTLWNLYPISESSGSK